MGYEKSSTINNESYESIKYKKKMKQTPLPFKTLNQISKQHQDMKNKSGKIKMMPVLSQNSSGTHLQQQEEGFLNAVSSATQINSNNMPLNRFSRSNLRKKNQFGTTAVGFMNCNDILAINEEDEKDGEEYFPPK